jgi:hypothetical protein
MDEIDWNKNFVLRPGRSLGEGNHASVIELMVEQGDISFLMVCRRDKRRNKYQDMQKLYTAMCRVPPCPHLGWIHHLEIINNRSYSYSEKFDEALAPALLSASLSCKLAWIADIACGLQTMHEDLEFVHNDVKIENVMIDRNGNAVLIDFGLACEFGYKTRYRGTPLYSAPEILMLYPGAAFWYHTSTDVHALGWCAWEILSNDMLMNYVQTNNLALFKAQRRRGLDVSWPCLACMSPLTKELYADIQNFCRAMQAYESSSRPRIETIVARFRSWSDQVYAMEQEFHSRTMSNVLALNFPIVECVEDMAAENLATACSCDHNQTAVYYDCVDDDANDECVMRRLSVSDTEVTYYDCCTK